MAPSFESIPVEDLIVRDCYRVRSRNLAVGVWDGNSFLGLREKFGSVFVFGEVHWDLSEHFGTAHALERIDRLPDDILLAERLPGSFCMRCDGAVEYLEEDRAWYHLSLPACDDPRPCSRPNTRLHEWLAERTPSRSSRTPPS